MRPDMKNSQRLPKKRPPGQGEEKAVLREFEIKNHFAIVQGVGFEHELHLAGVPVGEAALVRVLGEQVAVFDLDGFADTECHLALGYTMNQMGAGILLNERGQSLVDEAYRCLGYTTNEPSSRVR